MAFAREEYLHRLDATKRRMDARGIDVLLVTDPANMNYLTGYDGWSFYVPQVVAVACDEDQPLWIGRAMDARGARVTTFLKPQNILGYPDDYVQSPVKHPMDFIGEVLKMWGWHRRRLGLEMDSYYLSPMGYRALRRKLPGTRFVDAHLLVNWVRAVKSPAEIAYMRQAARILEHVMQTAVDTVAPGLRQCDAAAAIYHAMIRGTPECGGDYPAIVPMMPTGVGTSTPHLTWSDEPFKEGEATVLELAACRKRYHCPMARTVFLGAPPRRLTNAAAVVAEGLAVALDAVKPGVTCEEVELAWRRCLARSGLVKDSRIGYSTGLNYPPDWGEHTMSLRPGDTTPLEPNMTFHLILGIWMDDWGMELSECFRVTETGSEVLANFPRHLLVKD